MIGYTYIITTNNNNSNKMLFSFGQTTRMKPVRVLNKLLARIFIILKLIL